MSRQQQGLVELLGQHPLFVGFATAELAHVVKESSEVHLAKGEILYTSGLPAERVFVLLSGALQIEYPLPGEERGRVSAVLLSPHFLGECQVIHERTWSGTGVAINELVALGIRKGRFIELTGTYPILTRRLYFELTSRFLSAIETWRYQPTHRPEYLVARYLLALQEVRDREGRPKGPIELRQTELARATGIRPETANRMLAKWTKEQVVHLEAGAIQIVNPAVLAEVVADSPAAPLIQQCQVPLL